MTLEEVKEMYPEIPLGQRIKDIKGKTFGDIEAIYRTTDAKSGYSRFVCKCKKGHYFIRGCSDIRNKGEKNTCPECPKFTGQDLTNQKFGLLTILYFKEVNTNHVPIWHCKCDCGNECDRTSLSLKKKNTFSSCGCLNRNNLINKKFGKLTVISSAGSKNGQSLWHCQCECGNECDVTSGNLKSGNTQSCGCIGKSLGEYIINNILNQNNIHFLKQYQIKLEKEYRYFDFAILNSNNEIQYIIEYDGEQHFKEARGKWKERYSLIEIQKHDQQKNQWCENNNIPIIRIPYTHLNNIKLEDLLIETSSFVLRKKEEN